MSFLLIRPDSEAVNVKVQPVKAQQLPQVLFRLLAKGPVQELF